MTQNIIPDPANTKEEIIAATIKSLQRHGYADLTIENIGDEFEKSQSLIYHHYDGKDHLILETLEYVFDWYRTELLESEIDDPKARLEAFIDQILPAEQPDEQDHSGKTLVELRTQAIHDEQYREYFTQSDRLFREFIEGILRNGKKEGVFRDFEPSPVASVILTVLNGAIVQQATVSETDWIADVRSELDIYLTERVYR